MASLFRLNTQKITLSPEQKIIKYADFSRLIEANELIEQAKQRAAEIEKQAEIAYQERKEAGYGDGLMEGRMEYAEKMLDTALMAVDYIENLEQSLVNVVNLALRKIVGEIDKNELIVGIVRNALVSLHNQQRVLIKVSPQDESALRESLALMLKSSPGSVNMLDVLVDPRMNQGDCILESELGLVDASLEIQLKAIENALLRKIKAS